MGPIFCHIFSLAITHNFLLRHCPRKYYGYGHISSGGTVFGGVVVVVVVVVVFVFVCLFLFLFLFCFVFVFCFCFLFLWGHRGGQNAYLKEPKSKNLPKIADFCHFFPSDLGPIGGTEPPTGGGNAPSWSHHCI